MTERRKGLVSKIGKSKFSFFIQLDGEGFYYNTKFNPKVGEGDEVGIEFERKGEQRGNVKNVVMLKDNGGPKGYIEQASSGSWGGGGSSKAATGGDRQDSIVYQSSRKDALVLLGILLDKEAFALKGKADEKRVQIEALLDEITVRFFKDAENPRESAAFKTAKEIAKDSGDDWDASNDEGGEQSSGDDWGGGWD